MDALMTLFIVILVIAILVSIARAVFRINDIIKRLDKIIELLKKE